jgi:hypothetical protein
MIAGKRSPFGPKVELLVALPHQGRHPIPLLSPILAHRAYASANERESTGGRLASDHTYQALRAAAAWHAHHEPALASPERGSPSLARRMSRGLRPRGGLPAPQDPPPAGFSRSASKTRNSAVPQQDRKKAASLLQHSCGRASLNKNGALVTPFFLLLGLSNLTGATQNSTPKRLLPS